MNNSILEIIIKTVVNVSIQDFAITPQLLKIIQNDTISLSDAPIAERIMKNIRSIKKEYDDKIVFRERSDKSNIYYVYIDRKQIQATSKEKLYEKIYNLKYGVENWSMDDIFPKMMIWKRDNTDNSPRTFKNTVAEWNGYLKGKPVTKKCLNSVTSQDLINLYNEWTGKRELTATKFNNLKSIINSIYEYAKGQLGLDINNPSKGICMAQFNTKPVNNDDDVYSEEERNLILNHLANSTDAYDMAICFDFNVTMRFGELSGLRWSDVDNNNKIHVRCQHLVTTEMKDDLTFTKNHFINTNHVKGHTDEGFRSIGVIEDARKVLDRARTVNPTGEFIFMHDGKQLSISTFNSRLRRYCKELGIVYRPSHKIRFCVASILHKNGMPLPVLQKLLGHTKVSTTLHYLRNITPDEEILDMMEKCL